MSGPMRIDPLAWMLRATLFLAMGIGIALAARAAPDRAPSLAQYNGHKSTRPSFTVVPPGPVSDRTRVELRLAVPNPSATPRTVTVEFLVGRGKSEHLINSQRVTVLPGDQAFAHAWWKTEGQAGKHRLRYRVKDIKRTQTGEWPLEVIRSDTPALPRLQAGWLDPLGLDSAVYPRNRPPATQDVRETVRGMKRLGMSLVIITYVEYQGYFFYPSVLRFHDRDMKREAAGQKFSFDVVGTVLDEAERQGMHVILGLGRGGDTPLLWQFERPDWPERNREGIDISCRVARELWERYGHRRSFYGWYLTHEMNDLARASAYYDPVARFCHGLSPDKPVLAAPAGTPILTRDTLARSEVDIFAYQDAVGSGYVPYRNTFQPEQRIAMLPEVFRRYRELHAGTDKHLWADLELWEMDGSAGYSKAYPPPFSRVRKQIETEAPLVEMLTGYEIFGFLQVQGEGWRLKDRRATALAQEYRQYLSQLRQATRQLPAPPEVRLARPGGTVALGQSPLPVAPATSRRSR